MRRAAGQGTYGAIYAVVRRIPEGRVASYGQVAVLAGLPGHARQVGYALHALPEGSDVPWQRVINARGEVSPRAEPGWEGYQRHLLEEEGVAFDLAGRVDLDRFTWEPESGDRPRASRPRRPPITARRAPLPAKAGPRPSRSIDEKRRKG
jgi:methylated-DNA-protein-cysteine methyltransferase-like protein